MANERWVRVHDLFGKSVVPPDAAKVIQRAVAVAIERGDVSAGAAWQLIEFWAADYLAGVDTERQWRIRTKVQRINEWAYEREEASPHG